MFRIVAPPVSWNFLQSSAPAAMTAEILVPDENSQSKGVAKTQSRLLHTLNSNLQYYH